MTNMNKLQGQSWALLLVIQPLDLVVKVWILSVNNLTQESLGLPEILF